MAGAEGVPGVLLRDDAQVDEPVGLQRLLEVARRVCRNVPADIRDLLQFRPAFRIAFRGGHLFRQFRMAFGEADDGIGRHIHSLEFLLLVPGQRIVEEIEAVEAFGDFALEVEQALVVDDVAQHGVARRALLHELGEDAGLVGVLPGGLHFREDAVAHAVALPVGNDLLLLDAARLVVHAVGDLLAGVQDFEVGQRVAADFGVGGGALRPRSTLPDDELFRPDIDGPMLQHVGQRTGAQHGRRERPGVAVEFRDQGGAFQGEPRLGSQAGLA